MSQLIPCYACQRHIRLTDTACPFCSAASSAPRGNARAVQPAPSRGLKRAAVFALSASVSVTACGGESNDGDTTDQNVQPVYGAPVIPSDSADTSDSVSPSPSDPSTDSSDPGLAQPEYGAPVPPPDDTATDDTDVDGGDTSDSWDDTSLAQPEYGAPVPPPDDTATDDTATFGDAGTTDAGAAQDGGGVDGGNDPASGDAGSLDPDPVPTAVPLYGAPPSQLE